ncbi:MAG: type II toxin-antitoxin system HicB family antitoxin [Lachnospiraceae bacterium]
MKEVYPTFIKKEKECYLVYIPDFDIYTEGYSFPDAIAMARDAIGLKGISMEDDNIALPQPSSYEQATVKARQDTEDCDYTEGILTMVDIDFVEYRRKIDQKMVRRNVTLPNWLDYEARKAHLNVSKVLQEALMVKLNVAGKKGV